MRVPNWWCAVFFLCCSAAWPETLVNKGLKTLTTTSQVHNLQRAEADRHHAVDIHGWVSYYDPYVDPTQACMFLHDADGDIFVSLPKLPILPLRQGTPVEVTGWTGPGEFAPVVSHGQVRVLAGTRIKMQAPQIILPLLIAGGYDARFAAIEGVVQSVAASEWNVVLKLSTATGVVRATTLREKDVDYRRLVDAQVRLLANIGPQFNHRRQVTGAHLFFQSSEDVMIRRPAPADPFLGEPHLINDLIRPTFGLAVLNSIHIRGRTTLDAPGHMLCLQDLSGGLCVQTDQQEQLALGQWVDVVGFPTPADSITGLVEARYKQLGAAEPPTPASATARQLLTGRHGGELVAIEGRLIGADLNFGADLNDSTLTMESDGRTFSVVLPSNLRQHDWHGLAKGSLLRITGVCLPEIAPGRKEVEEKASGYDSFRLFVRSPADVVVLTTPPWWTGPRVLYVLSILAVVGVAGGAWVVVLRRRVDGQTRLIRESAERFRHLAEHDGLTGLANRRLLHNRLGTALVEARANGCAMALLTMDLDKFKQVNDRFGHPAGDAMLCEAAERISRSVRKGDTVARIGGDEFVVLLPVLGHAEAAEEMAERIVAAVAEPLIFEGQRVPMSASVGVCVYPGGGFTPDALMGNCDQALYNAKARGRNCWQVFAPERLGQDAVIAPC